MTPNPQWGTGKVHYDPSTGSVEATLDDGEAIKGTLDAETCSKIEWTTPVATWLKIPELKNVHVVFMNHLDVGYNGIPKTGFINNVLNTYFMEYFPRAVQLAFEMERIDPDSGFVYTTHPWLLNLYLNCPKDFVLNNVTLYCPTSEELKAMESALKAGYVAWHAGPMNMQVELMNSAVFKLALLQASDLNNKYKCCSQVLSQRDVPGMTAAAIPILKRNSIKAVSVGVNGGSAPPAVPKLFQWRPSNDSSFEDSITAMWHPGGYPGNYGVTLSVPGEISIRDSVISAKDGEALVFAFRTDNSGPPSSLAEIQSVFDVLRQQYRGAKVFASTFDNFVNSIDSTSLPVVVGEIGDNWIQGIASDPLKMAQYGILANALTYDTVLNDSSSLPCCDKDTDFYQALSTFVTKIPEHTWGLPSVYSTINWSNTDFKKVKNESAFVKATQSWLEQREFFYLAKQVLEMLPNTSKVYEYFVSAVKDLHPTIPNLDNFTAVNRDSVFKIGNDVIIAFDTYGSISSLRATFNNEEFTLADSSHPLGLFTYHTYNETDFARMNSQYDYYGNAGYDKPNSTANANPQTAVYHFPMTGLYRNVKDESIFLIELEGDSTAHIHYGGPEKVWIQVTVEKKDPSTSQGEIVDVSFEVVLVNKTATRLAEATMFSFLPALESEENKWQDRLYKINSSNSAQYFSVFSVIQNGSFYQHAVEKVNLVEQKHVGTRRKILGLKSIHVPLVCPILPEGSTDFDTPSPFPYMKQPTATNSVAGFAFNLHNNVWNTNYPLWYPFVDEDKTFKAKFNLLWYNELP